MADAVQVQRRRGTTTQCEAMTPAEGEVIVDMTLDTLRVGDGSRAGGFVMPNAFQVQNNTFTRAAVGGTGNAITLTLNPAPVSYSIGLGLMFIATASNTGAVTVNVNGLGNINLYKPSNSGVVALAGGEIIAGCAYNIINDGTQFQMIGGVSGSSGAWKKIVETSISGQGGGSSISIPSGYDAYDILLESDTVSAGTPSFQVGSIIIATSSQNAAFCKIEGGGARQSYYAGGGGSASIQVGTVQSSRISSILFYGTYTAGTLRIYGRSP